MCIRDSRLCDLQLLLAFESTRNTPAYACSRNTSLHSRRAVRMADVVLACRWLFLRGVCLRTRRRNLSPVRDPGCMRMLRRGRVRCLSPTSLTLPESGDSPRWCSPLALAVHTFQCACVRTAVQCAYPASAREPLRGCHRGSPMRSALALGMK